MRRKFLRSKKAAERKLLRCKEAADRCGLKPVSLRQLDKDGILHPIRDWAGHRRFREDEIEDFRKKLLSGEIGKIGE